MKIAITGGHFSPAYALIQEFKKTGEVIFLGRKYTFEKDKAFSFEYRVCTDEKIPFFEIITGRLQRNFGLRTLFSLPRFLVGLKKAYNILAKEDVDMVVSFGGYLSVPVACAAYFRKIPVVIHEQTQHAGIANKWIAKIACKVCISFESSRVYFPDEKTVLTGNPIRKEVFEKGNPIKIDRNRPLIYVTGGSGGSHFINKTIKEITQKLLEEYSVIHQTGDAKEYRDFDTLALMREKMTDEEKSRYYITRFVSPQEVGWILNNSDLLISRAGINTVSEVLALQKMVLFIPLPHGQKNEQLENARLIKKVGLGEYILQKEASLENVLEMINKMIVNKKKYVIQDKKEVSLFVMHDSVQRIMNELQLVYETKCSIKQKNSD